MISVLDTCIGSTVISIASEIHMYMPRELDQANVEIESKLKRNEGVISGMK